MKPILKNLYYKINPTTRAKLDEFASPVLIVIQSLRGTQEAILIFIAWIIMAHMWLDIYHNPSEYASSTSITIILGFCVLILTFAIIFIIRAVIIKIFKLYMFIKLRKA